MIRWERKRLEEVVDFCLGKMLEQNKNRGEYLPYLANVNVRWGAFDLEDVRQMRFELHERERYGLKYGDIVMCEGGEPGRCAIWKDYRPGMMIQKALHRIRPHECLDNQFLFYSFLQKGKTGGFAPLFTGSTIKHLPQQNLAKVEIDFPPLPIQKRIASVLSAYDDLIENNRRRISLLEEAARLLYREWFVHLRFPGHEHTPVVDGVPQGWARITVSDLGTVVTGKTPSTKNANNYGTDIPFIKTPDMHGSSIVVYAGQYLSEEGAESQRNKYIPRGSIMVSCIGTVGIVAMNATRAQTNQQINTVIPTKPYWCYYAYFALSRLKPELEAMGGGATMTNVSKGKFESIGILMPTRAILERFDAYWLPPFAQIENLIIQNKRLMEARDLLLPRLMNGEIAV